MALDVMKLQSPGSPSDPSAGASRIQERCIALADTATLARSDPALGISVGDGSKLIQQWNALLVAANGDALRVVPR